MSVNKSVTGLQRAPRPYCARVCVLAHAAQPPGAITHVWTFEGWNWEIIQLSAKISRLLTHIEGKRFCFAGTPQPDAGQNTDPPVQIIQQSELNAHQVNQLLQQLNVSTCVTYSNVIHTVMCLDYTTV